VSGDATLRVVSAQEPVCECCEPSPWGLCDARNGNLLCSRKRGHDGPHVACAPPDHELAEWTDEEIVVVELRETPVRSLFDSNGELRLWADSAGWNGYRLTDGDLYEVNVRHDAEEPLTKRQVDAEYVEEAIAEHIRDPHAGEAGEFVRGATPP